MGKFLHLDVPVPCHENWNNMTPENQGRFCMSCQKTVVDFTEMTDCELIQYFKNLNGNTCGRFRDDQLNRKYTIESKRRLNWLRYFFHILLPTLLITVRTYSQSVPKSKPNVCASPAKKKQKSSIVFGSSASILPPEYVAGTVTSERGEVLAGASVFIKDTEEGMVADHDGFFALNTKHHFPFTLYVTYVGYEPLEIAVEQKEINYPMKIVMKESTLEEVVVVSDALMKRRLGGAVSGIYVTSYRDLKTVIADSLKICPAKVYPNPLKKSQLLTLELKSKIKGNYTVLVTDINGKHLQIEQFSAESSSIQKQIRLKQTIVPGSYFVTIIDPKGKRLTSQKLVVMD